MAYTPTLLLILDGWGHASAGPGNGVALAGTPHLDRLCQNYPTGSLLCSGRAVGLPDGFMGNSEVGHMNIGAGRVIYQDMTRIDLAVEDGSLMQNQALTDLAARIHERGGRLHYMGLVSDGGVHSHVRHLYALLEFAKQQGLEVFLHAFMDGRDTSPTSGAGYLRQVQEQMQAIGVGRIATVIGRYWAMDRDKHWERNAEAYAALVQGKGIKVDDPVAAVEQAYAQDETDEFIKPRVVTDADGSPVASIQDGDGVFFFNFRADRARQISRSLFAQDFTEFERETVPDLAGFATMTVYESTFGLPAAFPPERYEDTLGEVLARQGLQQLRIAETEKYAHVTYFFNCGREEPFEGEDRVMVPSPRDVDTYDAKPQMSAEEVTSKLLDEWQKGRALYVCNLANLDMVGHTGVIPAVEKAVRTVDDCVGRIVEAVLASGGRALVTADHGNAEEMLDADGNVVTSHSKNPVPFVLVDDANKDAKLRETGKLGDLAPTILDLWGEPQPEAMTGESLIVK